MIRVLASEMQWQTSGQSRAALSQQLQSALKATTKDVRKARAGARLIREWNGKEHVVDVTDEGFVWRDRTWRSLSAIAKEITGTKWSGPRFFGVKS
jgi:16S rRNA G527 N7-methylase RsmG